MVKLNVELIPGSAFGQNARSVLSQEVWSLIRNDAYDKADHKCEACGSGGKLHAHEVWKWKWESLDEGVQALVGIKVLCPLCHESVHLGRATMLGRGQIAREHLCEVNGWTVRTVDRYLSNILFEASERSLVRKWVLDLSILDEQIKEAKAVADVIRNLGEW